MPPYMGIAHRLDLAWRGYWVIQVNKHVSKAGKQCLDHVRHRVPERKLGALKGRIRMDSDFNETSPDLIEAFEGRSCRASC